MSELTFLPKEPNHKRDTPSSFYADVVNHVPTPTEEARRDGLVLCPDVWFKRESMEIYSPCLTLRVYRSTGKITPRYVTEEYTHEGVEYVIEAVYTSMIHKPTGRIWHDVMLLYRKSRKGETDGPLVGKEQLATWAEKMNTVVTAEFDRNPELAVPTNIPSLVRLGGTYALRIGILFVLLLIACSAAVVLLLFLTQWWFSGPSLSDIKELLEANTKACHLH